MFVFVNYLYGAGISGKEKERPNRRIFYCYSGGADQARTDETVMVTGQESLEKKKSAQIDASFIAILVELIRLELTRR